LTSIIFEQASLNPFSVELSLAAVPANIAPLFSNRAQLEIFKILSTSQGLTSVIENIESLLSFSSYIQVRAFKAGASLKEALLFSDPVKLRALEAGASVKKALKTNSLKYVQHLEAKKNITHISETPTSNQSHARIKSIYKNLDAPIKYNLALDIDDVICREITNTSHSYNIDYQWISKTYPLAEIITWKIDNNNQITYFCYPGFDKLISAISFWNNWSVSFFSAEVASRNELVISRYFAKKLGNDLYSLLISNNRLKVFSKSDLANEESEFSTKLVKNLNIISNDTDNSILADDNISNAANGQEQMIGLSIEASKEFISMLKNQDEIVEEMYFNPLNNSYYIMGILLSAKELLKQKKAYCLREAIDLTLRYEGIDENKCGNPWYINPTCALKHDVEYLGKTQKWIDAGKKYLDQTIFE